MVVSSHEMMYTSLQAAFHSNDEPVFWCTNPQVMKVKPIFEDENTSFKHQTQTSTHPLLPNTENFNWLFNMPQNDWKCNEDVFCINNNYDKTKSRNFKPLVDTSYQGSFVGVNTNRHENIHYNHHHDISPSIDSCQNEMLQNKPTIENMEGDWNEHWHGFHLDLKDIIEKSNEQETITKPLQEVLDELETTRKSVEKKETVKKKDKIRLHEFILDMLIEGNEECVRWNDKNEGQFEIVNSTKIAKLWGDVKNNPTMTYEKLARALRHYYKLDILETFQHKEKLRYKFAKKFLIRKKILP